MTRLLAASLAVLAAASCGGGAGQDVTLGFDTQALGKLGVKSLTVTPFAATDKSQNAIDCTDAMASYQDTSAYQKLWASRTVDISTAETSKVVLFPNLPAGKVLILAVGFDKTSGTGNVVAVGCGEGTVKNGEKPVIVVAMEAAP